MFLLYNCILFYISPVFVNEPCSLQVSFEECVKLWSCELTPISCELTPVAEGSLPACSGTTANPPYTHPADLQEPAHPTSTWRQQSGSTVR